MKAVERFEMRLTGEDKARLRVLAERTSGNESRALRELLREAVPATEDIPSPIVPEFVAARGELARTAA